jgi:hypothetical protein
MFEGLSKRGLAGIVGAMIVSALCLYGAIFLLNQSGFGERDDPISRAGANGLGSGSADLFRAGAYARQNIGATSSGRAVAPGRQNVGHAPRKMCAAV